MNPRLQDSIERRNAPPARGNPKPCISPAVRGEEADLSEGKRCYRPKLALLGDCFHSQIVGGVRGVAQDRDFQGSCHESVPPDKNGVVSDVKNARSVHGLVRWPFLWNEPHHPATQRAQVCQTPCAVRLQYTVKRAREKALAKHKTPETPKKHVICRNCPLSDSWRHHIMVTAISLVSLISNKAYSCCLDWNVMEWGFILFPHSQHIFRMITPFQTLQLLNKHHTIPFCKHGGYPPTT